MANEPEEHKDPKLPPVFNDENTRKRIDEHLSNPEDEITEEDIRNVSTEPNPHYRVDLNNEDEKEPGEATKDQEPSPGEPPIQTPWDVLGSP